MEIQVKTKMRYRYTLIRMSYIKVCDQVECCQGRGATGTLKPSLGMKVG